MDTETKSASLCRLVTHRAGSPVASSEIGTVAAPAVLLGADAAAAAAKVSRRVHGHPPQRRRRMNVLVFVTDRTAGRSALPLAAGSSATCRARSEGPA